MLRLFLLSSALVVPLAAVLIPTPVPSCPNALVHEPMLLYDVSGGTVGGPIDIALTVYDDGTARLSSSTLNPRTSGLRLAFVGTDAARQLVTDLAQLGSGTLCDAPSQSADIPPATLTILRGDTDARAHTFSWFENEGAYGLVSRRIHTFLHTYFPDD